MNLIVRSDAATAGSVTAHAKLSNDHVLAELARNWSNSSTAVTMHSGLPLEWLVGQPKPTLASANRNWQLLAKRVTDIFGASLALAFLMPLLVLVALAIKLTSRGPVLYLQRREGQYGELFTIFKFRSMRMEDCDQSGITQAQGDDPRVTPLGRFLRRTSIDELPQLVNVVLGHMSLVGPRPHVPNMKAAGKSYRELVPYYQDRLTMRPGISGWAQVNGFRGPTSEASRAIGRIDHDIAYIQNFSLFLDVKIVIDTIRCEFLQGSGV
jgi:lipopolysaccharide/colanic/teichoic acid biosynthesis glycosyltransferase